MVIVQYLLLGLAVGSVAVYFFSGRKLILPVYVLLGVFSILIYARLTGILKLDATRMLLSFLFLAPTAAGDALGRTTDLLKTYLRFCIVSAAFVVPIMGITTVRNDFQFQPDSVWMGLIPVVALCIWLLSKSNEEELRTLFFTSGTALTMVFVAVLFFHPYMYMKIFKMSFLPISVRLNGVYFAYLLLFTVAGLYRLRLLPSTFNHARLAVPVVILGIASYSTRFPAIAKALNAFPITYPVPLVLGSLLILLIPAVVAHVVLNRWFPGK